MSNADTTKESTHPKKPPRKAAAKTKKAAARKPKKPASTPAAIFRSAIYDPEKKEIVAAFSFGEHTLHAPLKLKNLAAILSAIPWPIVADADGGESFREVLTILEKETE